MELSAILMARVSAFLEVETLDPQGRVSPLEAFRSLIDRYSFAKTSQKLEEFDLQKGLEFSFGKLGNVNIDRLTIFNNGIVIDTRSSTEDSEAVLRDFLEAIRNNFGATTKVFRHMFLSQLSFRSNMRLVALHPALQEISDLLASSVSQDLMQSLSFEPVAFILNTDLSQVKVEPGSFTIERRGGVPFTDSAYFSSAPIRTAKHIEVIQQLEIALATQRTAP